MATSLATFATGATAAIKKTGVDVVVFAPATIPLAALLTDLGIDPGKLKLLAIAIFADLALGFIKSIVLKSTSSQRMWQGLAGKASTLIAILGIGAVAKGTETQLGDITAAGLIVTAMFAEGVSIVRNAACIQARKELPEFNALAMVWGVLLERLKSGIPPNLSDKK